MPSQESIADAKANFVSAVSEGITVLMNRCGYSRERASAALMRELNRGETTRPSDEEVFHIVRTQGLGIEEATKTLVVSRALKRALSLGGSAAKAIELLTSKIALSKLLYESDEDPSIDEGGFRRDCITRVEKFVPRTSRAPSGRKPLGSRPASKPPMKSSAASRKRAIDEVSPATRKCTTGFQSRPRADSAADEIDAKIAKQSNEEFPANDMLRATPVGRAKRCHRSEDADALSQPLKRSRGTEGFFD